MSRKLGAIALAMAILVGAMSLKSAITTQAGKGAVLTANGPAPMPTYCQTHKCFANGPAPMPTYPTKRGVAQPTNVPAVR
jgi:hypothetical protein